MKGDTVPITYVFALIIPLSNHRAQTENNINDVHKNEKKMSPTVMYLVLSIRDFKLQLVKISVDDII